MERLRVEKNVYILCPLLFIHNIVNFIDSCRELLSLLAGVNPGPPPHFVTLLLKLMRKTLKFYKTHLHPALLLEKYYYRNTQGPHA